MLDHFQSNLLFNAEHSWFAVFGGVIKVGLKLVIKSLKFLIKLVIKSLKLVIKSLKLVIKS